MSTDRETTRVVRSWLEEGVTRLPDRVLDAVLDQVPATPQRRSWWPPRTFTDVNRHAQAAIAVATVLVVAVVAYSLLPGRAMPPGGQPTPTPQPTEVPRIPATGLIEPGTYRMGIGPYFLVTVPPGWESVTDGMGLRKHRDPERRFPAHHIAARGHEAGWKSRDLG